MTILLDIDGVMVTTPSWKPVETLNDGFMKFNEHASANLERIIGLTGADIVLTTTHRINYTNDEWKTLLAARGINANGISKLNDVKSIPEMGTRAIEIIAWVALNGKTHNYVVIDDDASINTLPDEIKNKCVITSR